MVVGGGREGGRFASKALAMLLLQVVQGNPSVIPSHCGQGLSGGRKGRCQCACSEMIAAFRVLHLNSGFGIGRAASLTLVSPLSAAVCEREHPCGQINLANVGRCWRAREVQTQARMGRCERLDQQCSPETLKSFHLTPRFSSEETEAQRCFHLTPLSWRGNCFLFVLLLFCGCWRWGTLKRKEICRHVGGSSRGSKILSPARLCARP